ncbi:hypothetical protein BDZ94DRAFT_923781 [Collybia nuda]|uniref:Blue (type 1) copper domain-containing protein n=1 Tax=Collybia nuda TaxID=64659 RepID=A0A9P6CCB8_9AGAR|nr:hypothetical protein BDZ94DRAFT_923781 [Collybia nuda]
MRLIIAFSSLALVTAQSVVVQVGSTPDAPGGALQFIPPFFNATKGTTVTFRFTGAPGNHSVTQSSFADPCNPVAGGFDSGNVWIPQTNVTDTPEWTLTITDETKPIWFYCKQPHPNPHCGAGMVGAINAPLIGNTFDNFQVKAKSFSGTPGQGPGNLVGVGASASALPSPITGGASLALAPTPTTATGGSTISSNPGPGTGSPVSTTTGAPSNTAPTSQQSSTGSIVPVGSFAAFLAAALGITML